MVSDHGPDMCPKNYINVMMLENAAKNLSYDVNPVIPIIMRKGDAEKKTYHDHDIVKTLMYTSKIVLVQGDKDLKLSRKEFSFFCKHADRRSNIFVHPIKCLPFNPKGTECDWCKENPTKDCEAFRFEKELFFEPIPF